MARMWKRFKKYERHFLIGLVVILLATFSITGALRSCGRGAAAERDYGGSVEAAPGRRVTISDDDFRAVSARYSPFLRTTGWGPSLRYGPDMPVNPLALRDTDLKSWTHIATVEAAKAAGYGVSEEELQQGIEAFVTRAWQAEGHGVVMFSPELYDKILGIHYRGGAKADFEETVKEILLKDKFLAPLVDSMRFSKSREEALAAVGATIIWWVCFSAAMCRRADFLWVSSASSWS